MNRFIIAGHSFRRESTIRLTTAERATVKAEGVIRIARPVEWPIPGREPLFRQAYTDPGGTDLWGPGPYLKVPNVGVDEDDEVLVNRVFCPWGYPPQGVRVFRRPIRLQIENVELSGGDEWQWFLTLRLKPADLVRSPSQ